MKTPIREPEFTEPERYELHEGSFYHFEISRREFVQVLGAGVVLSVAVPSLFAQRAPENRPTNLAQRLHIGADGVITVLTSKVEVGQGSRTQLTQAAAEELRVPVDRVRFIMADTAVVPDDGGTAGSGTSAADHREGAISSLSTQQNARSRSHATFGGCVARRFGRPRESSRTRSP